MAGLPLPIRPNLQLEEVHYWAGPGIAEKNVMAQNAGFIWLDGVTVVLLEYSSFGVWREHHNVNLFYLDISVDNFLGTLDVC